MSKRVVLSVVAAVLVACLGWLAWLVQRPLAPVAAATIADVEQDARIGAEPAQVEAAGVAPASRSASSAERAVEASSSEAPATALGEAVEVHVIRKSDRKPVANAQVHFATRAEQVDEDERFSAWISNCALEERLAPIAEHFVADEAGTLHVPPLGRSTLLVAQAGSLWGYVMCGPATETPIEIELVPDADIDVRVVDRSGLPVAEARVVLRMRSRDWHFDQLSTVSAADGSAKLRHAGHALRSQGPGFSGTWFAGLGAALSEPVEVELDPRDLPDGALRLVMPPTGECEVRVLAANGALYAGLVQVSLRMLRSDESTLEVGEQDWRHDATLPHMRGGTALFRHVEIGRSFEAQVKRVSGAVEHRARDVGPSAVGQRAVIAVRMGDRTAVLAGRAVDAGGAPLAGQKLRARVIYESLDDSQETTIGTDPDGRFELDAEVGNSERSPRWLTICTFDAREREQASATRALPGILNAGLHELGDFALAPSPLLVAGIVVDARDRPVAGALVSPATRQVWDESDPNGFWWQELWSQRSTSDHDGRFEIRGRVEARELGLWASKRDAKGGPVLAAPGARDVIVRVDATGEIAGAVLLDASVGRELLSISAMRTSEVDNSEHGWMQPVALDEQGQFRLRGLRPGSYTLSFNNATTWEPLHELADVLVEGGAVTRDPRFDPLDLRASLRAFRLDIVDTEERPIAQGSIFVSDASGAEGSERNEWFHNGKATLFHGGLGLNLKVRAEGHRPVTLHAVSTDQTVVLRRGAELRLHLASGLRTPEAPIFLGARVETADGTANELGFSSIEEMFFDARGRVKLRSDVVGRVKLVLTLTLQDEDMWSMTDYDDGRERVLEIADREGEQLFEVNFDPRKLEEHVAALLAAREVTEDR